MSRIVSLLSKLLLSESATERDLHQFYSSSARLGFLTKAHFLLKCWSHSKEGLKYCGKALSRADENLSKGMTDVPRGP